MYRAPLSPDCLDRHQWFCLDHIRAFNKAWNFCAGRNAEEIERMIREDMVGWRPTWPLGRLGRAFTQGDPERLRRDFSRSPFGQPGAQNGEKKGTHKTGNARDGEGFRAEPDVAQTLGQALSLLGLSPPVTASALKTRYKALAKRYHPDTNGGDRTSEERLKRINQAYATLKLHYGA